MKRFLTFQLQKAYGFHQVLSFCVEYYHFTPTLCIKSKISRPVSDELVSETLRPSQQHVHNMVSIAEFPDNHQEVYSVTDNLEL